MRSVLRLLAGILLLGVLSLVQSPAVAQQGVLVVSSEGPYATLNDALAAAQAGDVIEVHGGVHQGPFIVETSVTLVGYDWPVIDGGGVGTVVKLTAPGTAISGFVIRNSGDSLDQENSGISGQAPNLTIENNRLEEMLFGIYLLESSNTIVRNNEIHSKDLSLARRGDAIRAWVSHDVLIEGNQVDQARDVVLWYSERLTVRNNRVENGRYGLHFMYCDDAVIESNWLLNNSVGTFMMYSRRLQLLNNTIVGNHGPSGYGIGLKDMDDARVIGNAFVGNRIGAYLDNSPREVNSVGWFEGNLFAYNDIGIQLMPSVRNNQFTGNSFIDNQEQVSISGGGQVGVNSWTVDGRGNYWSDYAGYDRDQDGLGDEPYRSERLFENLTNRHDLLRLFIYSPASQAVDFAARAVPLVKPQPKLIDEAPLMAPVVPVTPPLSPPPRGEMMLVSLGLLSMVGLFAGIQRLKIRPRARQDVSDVAGGEDVIRVQNLTKRFGDAMLAVDDLSFEVAPGESVALWGPNGAGKTTALRCLLGLLPCEGSLQVAGFDVRKQGKAVRGQVGFVPQELNFHDDMSVAETMQFYALLKKVADAPITELLKQLNLARHLNKQVGELSGGMKQRLALAIALLSNPAILMLDEPTANLDIRGRDDLLNLLAGLKNEGKTLIFSSHRPDEVMALADRVLVMDQGKLVTDCPPSRLHEQAGWRAMLRLYIPEGSIKPAIATLTANGFAATPNGHGVWVKVVPNMKGRPIDTLIQAGITVNDFEIEHFNEDA